MWRVYPRHAEFVTVQPTHWQQTPLKTMTDDRLSDIFFARSAATTRDVLARLALSDATVKELAEPYGISLAAVLRRPKVLENADLIPRTKDAQYRPCHLNAAPLQAAANYY